MSSDDTHEKAASRSGQPSAIVVGLNPSEGRDLYGHDPAAISTSEPKKWALARLSAIRVQVTHALSTTRSKAAPDETTTASAASSGGR
jgi:hypothetical protein